MQIRHLNRPSRDRAPASWRLTIVTCNRDFRVACRCGQDGPPLRRFQGITHDQAGCVRAIMPASAMPEIACQIPQNAATTAIPPKPLKNPKIRISPNPEF